MKNKISQIRPKYEKLQIGCGRNKINGFVNIDKSKEVSPDIVVDIEKGFPFPDNSFKEIYSSHCLEHIRPQYWSFVLNQIARIAKEGCFLELKLPFDNIGQRTNMDHYRTFSWNSFDQLEKGNERKYYSDLSLIKLSKTPSKFKKLFYYLFPFMKYEVHFKFKIVKNKK
jgi:predicted SAM-dependent methyltransferase|tara:strand:- start:99 stop:605 length:507 start_codon:yes stop_codon:yes gene_type:complete